MAVGFRVADSTRYAGLIPQYNSLLAKQIDVQTQIASGKRYQRADENPTVIGLAQKFNVDDKRLEQNVKNIQEIDSFSDFTYGAIANATEIVQRARELAVVANDATKSPSERNAVATEIDRLLKGLVDIGAQNYRGRYLFSGTQTDQQAFSATTDANGSITSVSYIGNDQSLQTEYTPGRTLEYNMLGSNENGGSFGMLRDVNAGIDVFQTMIDLRDTLLSSPTGIGNAVGDLDAALAHLSVAAVRIGSVQNRLDSTELLHEDQREVIGTALGKMIETDYAEAATRLAQLNRAYEAALQVGSRVGELSLLNYLR
jgi:flagellar hook-associated protein 3 FlgL